MSINALKARDNDQLIRMGTNQDFREPVEEFLAVLMRASTDVAFQEDYAWISEAILGWQVHLLASHGAFRYFDLPLPSHQLETKTEQERNVPNLAILQSRLNIGAHVIGGLAGGMSMDEVCQEYDVSQEDARAALRLAAELIDPKPVQVLNDQIVVDPHKMIPGLGYPAVFKGRQWWVENVDGDTIRYYRGSKV